ncbi:MAG: beta-ketoacyl-ACP synthase [Gammaproteobacteria bacterium]|nr:beta-ketoacyl-ACP synthase [Gammaproteobacteria bacterium]
MNKPHRVVITGCGGLTGLGHDWPTIRDNMEAGRSAVARIPGWEPYKKLRTRLGAPAAPFDLPAHYTRKRTRSMGRVALLAVRASELALEDAGLLGDPVISSGRTGVAYGSASGSLEPILSCGRFVETGSLKGASANSYVQQMAHTGAVNIDVFFSIRGRIIPTCSACTSASQAIGYAWETLRQGQQDVMLAGGADELSIASAIVFDMLYATSIRNDEPEASPRPFDRDRDGIVLGEGGATVVLETLEHARARGAHIYAEVVGFGTNADGTHVTQPNAATIAEAMRLALADADLEAERIGYVNAHATGTSLGDVAESEATLEVMGAEVPVGSFKGYFGHTLGACGSLEAWLTIEMMNAGHFAPTHNLEHPAAECAALNYHYGESRNIDTDYIMTNNFAFGGINTSLIFRRWR